jgi:Undecaprenyl-phosphate glucose phosphotransferase
MSLRLAAQRFYFRCFTYVLPLVAMLLATGLRFHTLAGVTRDYDSRFYVAVAVLLMLAWIISAEQNRLCQLDDLFQEYTGIKKVFAACASTYVILICAQFFYRQQTLSRIVLAASACLLFVFALVSRALFRMLLRGSLGIQRRLRILLVGADADAWRIASRLDHVPFVRPDIVGCVRLPNQTVRTSGVPTFELEEVAKGLAVAFDDVVVAVSPQNLNSLANIVRCLEPLCAPIHTVLDLGDVPVVRERLFRFGDLQMLDLASTPAESPGYFLFKRIFDVGFSSSVLLVATPLMLAIALLIRLTSRGPVFFRQERIGLNGRGFRMLKFRTMRVASQLDGDTHWTSAADHRRTRLGAFLRRYSLDELPQFFNVLKGEMSVVGPRPERPFFVEKFLSDLTHYNTRHQLKVGITGWAQVNGWRGDTSIAKRLEFDRYYLQNWSLWFDLRIVILTIWAAIFGRNAY